MSALAKANIFVLLIHHWHPKLKEPSKVLRSYGVRGKERNRLLGIDMNGEGALGKNVDLLHVHVTSHLRRFSEDSLNLTAYEPRP